MGIFVRLRAGNIVVFIVFLSTDRSGFGRTYSDLDEWAASNNNF